MTGHAPGSKAARLFGVEYRRLDEPPGPPRLYVVVDTEEEFDWSAPFSRRETRVSNIAAQERAQSVLEPYGVRPVYLVDYPVATQPEGYEPLRAIHARGACEIGAHLHPWTNPPFNEAVNERNSFPGNLEPRIEEAKLARLVEAIQRGFGLRPLYYKAGRYGIGPNTLRLAARHGIRVDFSVMPGVDLRAQGGPDLRGLSAGTYEAGEHPVRSVPMTRGHTGPLAAFGPAVNRVLDAAPALRLRGALARVGLFRSVALTPEGVPTRELLRLASGMVRRGHKTLVMHYHSPSLVPGHTPYVRTRRDADELLARIDAVCAHVLGRLGGTAGDPRDLLKAGPAFSRPIIQLSDAPRVPEAAVFAREHRDPACSTVQREIHARRQIVSD